ncbi:MAG: hypothetical protein RI563_08250, partial [Thiohalophilus sp.]|uniref:hypothetical protein n=1 Tax=Thiohalophilus sp. TaxID=3028392 RepID=UPI00286FBC5A
MFIELASKMFALRAGCDLESGLSRPRGEVLSCTDKKVPKETPPKDAAGIAIYQLLYRSPALLAPVGLARRHIPV